MRSTSNALVVPFLFLFATLVACETPRVASPHHVIGSTIRDRTPTNCANNKERVPNPSSDLKLDYEICDRALTNLTELAWYKEHEWHYNRGRDGASKPQQRPLVCVAISGGGIRSAAFGIGVMNGLHKKEVEKHTTGTQNNKKSLLKYVDILSGTSGGAYAVSWYYMQYPTNQNPEENPDHSNEKLFDSQGYFQQELQENAHFIGMPAYIGSAFSDVILLSPFNFLFNGLWGTHTNTSLGHYIYRTNIKNTFYSGDSITLADLRDKIEKNKLPYFIITTTSRIDENAFHTDSLLRNTVFEFTPLRMGNDGFTYIKSDENAPLTDLGEIVAISGAAPDSSQAVSGGAQRFLASGLNTDYGRYIKNYNDTRHRLRRSLTKLAPIPLYFFTESYNRDLYGSDIYLSDGGHQENLAAYPLIRRQCEHLIIVDGEYDDNYEFKSYFKLKQSIERELQVSMTLTRTDSCKNSPRVDCLETDIERIEDAFQKNAERPGARGEAEDRRKGIPRCCFSGQHPIVNGKIRHFPILDKEPLPGQPQPVGWQETTVTYIKLAIDEDLFKDWKNMSDTQHEAIRKQIGTDAANYFVSVYTNTCDVRYFYPCAFPQFSTAYQSFTDTQFKAYVDLGATMVKQHLKANLREGSLELIAQ